MKKRWLSFAMAIVMCLTMAPVSVLAVGPLQQNTGEASQDNREVPDSNKHFTLGIRHLQAYDGNPIDEPTLIPKDGVDLGKYHFVYYQDGKQMNTVPSEAGEYSVHAVFEGTDRLQPADIVLSDSNIYVVKGNSSVKLLGYEPGYFYYVVYGEPFTVRAEVKPVDTVLGNDGKPIGGSSAGGTQSGETPDIVKLMNNEKVLAQQTITSYDKGKATVTLEYDTKEKDLSNNGNLKVIYTGGTNLNGSESLERYILNVMKKTISVTGLTAVERKWEKDNRNVKLNTENAELSGVLEGDEVSIEKVTGNVEDAMFGDNKPVEVSITLEGKDAKYYEAISAEPVTVNITKEEPRVAECTLTLPPTIKVPTAAQGEAVYPFTIEAKDQYGEKIDNPELIKDNLSSGGIVIDNAPYINIRDNALVITSEAAEKICTPGSSKTFNMGVKCGGYYRPVEFTLQCDAAQPDHFSIKKNNQKFTKTEDSIPIPTTGNVVTNYRIYVMDQYNSPVETPVTVTAEPNGTEGNFAYTGNDASNYHYVTIKPEKEIGDTFTLTIRADGVPDYTITITATDLIVEKPTYTIKRNPVYGDTWDKIVTLSGGSAKNADGDVSGTFSVDPEDLKAAPDAGEQTVRIVFNSTDNKKYENVPVDIIDVIDNHAIVIGKADASVTRQPAANNLEYTGGEWELVAAGEASGGLMLYSVNDRTHWQKEIPKSTDAGNYTVWYKVSGDKNHHDTEPASVNVTIDKAVPAASDFTYTAPTDLTYSGLPKTAQVVANLSGKTGMGAVTVRYFKNGVETAPTAAGKYIVKTAVGEGTNYKAAAELLTDAGWTFTITKSQPTIALKDYNPSGAYSGQALADPSAEQLELTGAAYDDVEFTWYKDSVTADNKLASNPENAGTYVLVASVPATENTEAASVTSGAIEISPVDYTGTKTAAGTVVQNGAAGKTVTLPAIPAGAAYGTPASATMTDMSIAGSTLTYTASVNSAGTAVTITVPVTAGTNHNSYDITVTITYTALEEQVISYADNTVEKVYGDAGFTNALTKTTVDGTISYSVSDTDVATVDAGTGAVTIKGAGAATVTATADETATHAEATASYTLTVSKKTAAAKPNSFTIRSNQNFPALTWKVEGLIPGDTLTADNADQVKMEIRRNGVKQETVEAGVYEIVFTTAPIFSGLKNYTITNGEGTMTVNRYVPYGGGSSGTAPKREIRENPDGSTTETVTKPDGTKVETTKSKNGDRSVTETKPDGSSVTETKRADGSTAKTETDAAGKSKAEANISREAVEKAEKAGEAVELPLPPLTASKDTESAPEITVNTGTEKPVKVTIPVENRKPGTVAVIVHADGTEEVIRKTGSGENGVTVSVEDGATLKIVDKAKKFDDVDEKDWYQNAVDFAASRSLYSGTSPSSFSPEESMTRGMLAQVLYNLESNPESDAGIRFSDVNDENWYAKPAAWAASRGIVSGYPDGSFGGEDFISREELAQMLYNFVGKPAVEPGRLDFPDADKVSSYAQDAIRWAVRNGIMSGDGTNLNPQGETTRAEVAAMLMSLVNNIYG